MEQLELLEAAPPKLTEKQEFILDALRRAGHDGAHADELHAQWCALRRIHSADERCRFDGGSGRDVLEALKKRGLARYRRGKNGLPGYWLAEGVHAPEKLHSGQTDVIPF